jgi:photosystem II stability/assembly factor-like uncharacterized protein
MRRIRIDITIVLGFVMMLFLCTNALAMKLLTPKIGWTLTEKGLYWTTNAGTNWQNITPQSVSGENITAVFFLNTSQGWVVCCDNSGKQKRFNIAFTNDSGVHWSISPLKTPASILAEENRLDTIVKKHPGDLQFQHSAMGGTGWIDFINSNHGWMILGYYDTARPTDIHTGIILETIDGGKTWKQVGDNLPTAGDFHFVTTKDSWLTSHVGSGFLYVTHNGGDTWQKVTLPPPPPLSEEDGWYDLPIFKDSQNGFMPVTYETENLPSLVLFVTHDGGKTWKADRVLPNMKDIANVYPSTVVDSVLITLSASESDRSLTLIKVFPGGRTVETEADALDIKGNLTPRSLYFGAGWHLSFINSNQGWVSTYTSQLLSTSDGGATWTVITPQ